MDDTRLLATRLLAQSPGAMPIEEALAHIKERRRKLTAAPAPKPEPNFAPAPMPVVDDPGTFAAAFFQRKASPLPDPPKPKHPPGRKPVRASKDDPDLRIIDGGKDGAGDK